MVKEGEQVKTNMKGAKDDYSKLLKFLEEDKTLYWLDYSIGEAFWHCWSEEGISREKEILRNVQEKYNALIEALKEAIGRDD